MRFRTSSLFDLLTIGLAPLGPVFLHTPADFSLLRRRHRLASSRWPGRSRRRRAATAQPGEGAVDRSQFLRQLRYAGFRTPSRVFLQIESGQMKPPIWGEAASHPISSFVI